MDIVKHFTKRGGELPSAITDCSELPFLEDYSIPLHIGAIFCLLFFSFVGVVLPLFVKKIHKRVTWAGTLLNYGRAFGAGTILATAFIHMIVPGFVNLTNPCVPEAFLEYVAFSPALTLFSILGMNLLHFLFISYHHNHCCDDNALPTSSQKQVSPAPVGASLSNTTHQPKNYSQTGSLALMFSSITLHSVIIGITLGVAAGSEFVALWIALSFHQFFEGIALGAAVVDKTVTFKKAILPWLYYAGFSISTPLGAAIGVGIHESYNPNSAEALVAVGIIDSLCAGILIYTGLMEFIGPEITDNQKFRIKSWKEKTITFASLYAGAILMAVLGLWV